MTNYNSAKFCLKVNAKEFNTESQWFIPLYESLPQANRLRSLVEFFTFNIKLPEKAILAPKDFTATKKFPLLGLNLMITGSSVVEVTQLLLSVIHWGIFTDYCLQTAFKFSLFKCHCLFAKASLFFTIDHSHLVVLVITGVNVNWAAWLISET